MFAEELFAFVCNIDPFPVVGDVVGGSDGRVGISGERVGNQGIGRHDQLDSLLLGLFEDFERYGEHVGFADRVPDLSALCCGEGVGHTAADDDRIDLLHEFFDDRDLGRNLRTADDGAERTLRILHHAVDRLQLVLHDIAEHLVVGEIFGDQRRRGVCTVCRAECVVDVAVCIRSELLDELLLRALFERLLCRFLLFVGCIFGQPARFALFLGIEAEVFEQHHFAGLEVLGHFGSLFAHAVAGEQHFMSQACFDGADDVFEREFHIVVLLGASQMRHENYRSPLFEYFLDSGDRCTDTGIVRDFELVVQRHIEIHADNGAFPFEIIRIDCEHNDLVLMYLVYVRLRPAQLLLQMYAFFS